MPKPLNTTRLVIYLIVAVIVGAAAGSYVKNHYETGIDTTPIPPAYHNPTPLPSTTPGGTAPSSVPATLLLSIPFTTQAPKANWAGIYAEGCEEASSLMAKEYLNGNTSETLDTDYAINGIQSLADWEMEHFGYNLDINNSEVVQMIEGAYGLHAKIVSNFTQDDIKKEVAQNHVVLFPANGIELNNPNFRRPGPPYHMLVIKGYNSLGFVTNDPGTRNGRNYVYSFETLYSANGNYSHDTKTVDTSVKQIIVVWK